MTGAYLSQIYIYPVKSLAGIRLEHWDVTVTGFKYDRKWMLVDSDHQFLSQRRLPRMALINTSLSSNKLILSAPGMIDFVLELVPNVTEAVKCIIWRDAVDCLAVSEAADQWFSCFLNTPCRLVYLPDESIRPVDQNYAGPADITALSDGFPFLIFSENSLVALNNAMQLELAVSRFRPNLVVSGCEAYAEDYWREIAIGTIGFRLPKPCSRCSVPAIDPETAEPGKEPLTTLNRLRKWENKVYFGQNALHNSTGTLTVGDKVEVIQTGEQQPPLTRV